jgi:hypothetical protein
LSASTKADPQFCRAWLTGAASVRLRGQAGDVTTTIRQGRRL